jgi:hypothetical protein
MNPLDAIEIPVPCQASWEAMKGDDRMRFCGSCRLHVYNLSEMTRKEAEALVSGTTGKACVRLYRRPDGKVLTRSCRAALLLRRATAAAFALVATAVVGFFAWLSTEAALGMLKGGLDGVKEREPYRTIRAWITPPTPGPVVGKMIMGTPCPPPDGGT